MKKKDIGMVLVCMALGAVLFGTTLPAKAAEPSDGASAQAMVLKVSSYKGNTLSVGDRSMVVVSPYGTSVTAVSSNPGVIALEQVGGFYVMVVKSTGTAVVSVTDDAGNTASMTMTVGGAESSPTPPPAESSSPAQAPESSDPVVNSEWSHNPDADLTANMEIRQEMVRLINQVRQEHGLAELPIDNRLMNAMQDVSTQHFLKHTQYEREALVAYGWLYGGSNNLTSFGADGESDIASHAVRNWVNSPGHLQAMLREDVTCIGTGVTVDGGRTYCYMSVGSPDGHGLL